MIVILFIFNWGTTGSPLETSYTVSRPEIHQLGFDSEFTLLTGVTYSLNNLHSMDDWFLGFPSGSFLLVVAFALCGKWNRYDWLFLAMIFSLSGAYVFYRYQDSWHGPRFLYEALFCLSLLSARGALVLYALLRSFVPEKADPRVLVATCAPVFLLIVFFAGYSTWNRGQGVHIVQANYHLKHRDVMNEFRDRPDAVVFVSEHVRLDAFLPENLNYPEGPLFPKDLGERNKELMETFPDRDFFGYDGAEVTPMELPEGS